MAKGNMFQGMARGKVGDVVFSRLNGQQISRVRNRAPKNPRSEKQLTQRIIMNTVMQAYSKMSAIVDHSFEGYRAGQETMSQFMSLNAKLLRSKVSNAVANNEDLASLYAFTPLGASYYSPNEFIVAKGSLPTLTAEPTSSGGATASTPITNGGTTYESLISALGLKRGDQITFIAMYANPSNEQDGQFLFARVILDPTNTDGTPAPLSTPLTTDGVSFNLPSPRNEGSFASLDIATSPQNLLTIRWGFASQILTSAAVIVSSKKTDGTWARSNAVLSVSGFGAFASGYLSFAEALDRAMYGDIDFLSDRYLNNAGTGRLPNTTGEVRIAAYQIGNQNVLGFNGKIPYYAGVSTMVVVNSANNTLMEAAANFINLVPAAGYEALEIGTGSGDIASQEVAALFTNAFNGQVSIEPYLRP